MDLYNRILKHWPRTTITTLSKLIDFSTATYAKRKLSSYVDGSDGYTYDSFRVKCVAVSHQMSRFGIKAGNKVAILSQNMPNWTVAFFSAVAFGRVAVPILPDSSESEVTNILTHSDTQVLFVSQRYLSKISEEVKAKMKLIYDIESLTLIKKDESAYTCEGWTKEPQPDDLAAIIYTSGTSGNAKGVMLSHRNFCQNIIEAVHAQPAGKRDRWLSILPMSHTYELTLAVLYPLFVGACVYYLKKAPTPTVLMAAMKQVRPTIMCSVPLIIEKVYRSSVMPTIARSRVLTWMEKHMPWLLYKLVGPFTRASNSRIENGFVT